MGIPSQHIRQHQASRTHGLMRINNASLLALTVLDGLVISLAAPLLPDYTGFISSLSGASPAMSILASHTSPAEHIYSSSHFSFHINYGPSYPGGLIARSLWWILTDARRQALNETVPFVYESRYHNLPAFHLEVDYGTFNYGDLIDLCEALRIVTRDLNDGRLPAYGGVGSRWHGKIYNNGSHIVPDGRFYFDRE